MLLLSYIVLLPLQITWIFSYHLLLFIYGNLITFNYQLLLKIFISSSILSHFPAKINKVFTKMDLPLEKYGSHSFRKFFSQKAYIESGYNVELVRQLLQHSNITTTQHYLGVGTKQVEKALASTVQNIA